jgi:hypothetical protein
MNRQKILAGIFLLTGLFTVNTTIFSQDPNFYIFLCFGQSNMEGQGAIEYQDMTVNNRFRVMEGVNCSNLGRNKGSWYDAVPPLCRCWNGLSPSDYFGRMMVANLPDSIRVGVINVSVAGCKIELFDKDTYQDYVSTVKEDWLINIINEYDGNPYRYLIDLAQQAQQDGVIKGILLHQGESNTNDKEWPSKVKKIYNDMITDLSLNADSVPLLAGEVVNADQGGICASMNNIIATLPDTLPNSYVISSSGCTAASDHVHFNSAGYREIGRRYAVKMLSLLGDTITYGRGTESIYLEPECATIGEDWEIFADNDASNRSFVTIKAGMNSTSQAPADSAGIIYFPFTVDTTGNFSIFARLNCPNANDDSYWVKMDTGSFQMVGGLVTSGWQWRKLTDTALTAGEHTLAIAYSEDGAKLDKINISNYPYAPTGFGSEAVNICIPDIPDTISFYLEAECATVGENWKMLPDNDASNGTYVTIKAGLNSTSQAPADSAGIIYFPFTMDTTGNFSVFARLNCPSTIDDSYWVKIDTGSFQLLNGLTTSGWQWKQLTRAKLTAGEHSLAIAYCEDGAKLDKINISNSPYAPSGLGEEAVNICIPDTATPSPPAPDTISVYLEPECATVGENWEIAADTDASNGSYITARSGMNSTGQAPSDSADAVYIPFTLDIAGNYSVFAHLDCPGTDHNSYWVKMDNGTFMKVDGLTTNSWQWKLLTSNEFTAGTHTLVLAYSENGAKLDKINITNYPDAPTGTGGEAENKCVPDTATNISALNRITTTDKYTLEQNYPNPFNGKTTISFEIPDITYVSLKVYNMLGEEITELAGKVFSAGKHTVEFTPGKLSNGEYFYVMKAGSFTATRKMTVFKK